MIAMERMHWTFDPRSLGELCSMETDSLISGMGTPVLPMHAFRPLVAAGLPQFVMRVPHPVFVLTPLVQDHDVTKTLTLRTDLEPQRDPRHASPLVIPIRPRDTGEAGRVTVGRAEGCDIQLPFAGISRLHAVVNMDPHRRFFISDAGSKNGTLLNGDALDSHKLYLLPDDALVMFAEIEVTFLLPETFFSELSKHTW
jgi:hypothetical protein